MAFIERLRIICNGSRALAWLVFLNLGVGLAILLVTMAGSLGGFNVSWLHQLLGLSSSPSEVLTHPWTLLTYMVVQFAPLHLLFNVLWLLWFGRMFCDIASDRSLLRLYIGGGIAGGLLYLATCALSGHTHGEVLAGSSASILSIMLATALLMPDRTMRLFLFGDVKLKWIAAICILLCMLGSGVAEQGAHIGGLLFGLGWTAMQKGWIRKPRKRESRRINTRATIRAINEVKPDTERLDELLDKIRISGYESLTSAERSELNFISSRLDSASGRPPQSR